MKGNRSLKTTIAACAAALFLTGVSQTGCGCGTGDQSQFLGSYGDAGGNNEGGNPPPVFGDEGGTGEGGNTTGTLAITPPTATIPVTIQNGVVTTNAPVTFSATLNGAPTTGVTWSIDRGELGSIDATGKFTASGTAVGVGNILATLGNRQATAAITVTITNKQNGAVGSAPDAGAGGLGGVGGEPLGGPVTTTIQQRLENDSNVDPSLAYLYPYDKTVFPRGILPPLLMWNTSNTATAVYLKITEANFNFEGVYSVASYTGDATQRVRIDDAAWTAATEGNTGDPLVVTVKIYSTATDTVYGPITESFTVAPGILTGTVYYNSYDSHLTGQAAGINRSLGGVIAIKPRSPNPALAVPAMEGKCHVCHSLSADGSTLFAEDGDFNFAAPTASGDYRNGASYNLVDGGARTEYQTVATDGTTITNAGNDRKFVWSAPYPDGSFALASYGYARETYYGDDSTRAGPSQLFARADGSAIASNINSFATSAVTPAFSPDGRKVVFNFWTGTGGNGVTAGAGHSLAVLDFSCGAKTGALACAAGSPYAFANMREIYHPATTADGGPFLAWPSFTPDAKSIVFHQSATQSPDNVNPIAPPTQVGSGDGNSPTTRDGRYNDQLSTWLQAEAEIYLAHDDGTNAGIRLNALNGRNSAGVSYLPTSSNHPDDTTLNYMPTVNPVASGGYFWVVFESRRKYGNELDTDPWATPGANCPPPDQTIANCYYGSTQKKLWVAAIDIATGTVDPSHPAFYLPGQELDAGNARGFWVVDPCEADGSSCQTGDQCCNGFCRASGDGGALTCQTPTTPTCSQQYEKCTVDTDCCDYPTDVCIGGRCSQKGIGLK